MTSRGAKNPYVQAIGASATGVTQSCYIVRFKKYIIMLDCGLYQENDIATNYKKNQELLKKIKSRDIDWIILHECHADHICLVPALFAKGCQAHVYVPEGSTEFLKLLWEDSLKIFTQDCQKLNRNGIKATPFYSEEDIERALNRIVEVPIGQDYNIAPDICLHYYGANHIIHACQIHLTFIDGYIKHRIGYTGDIGPERTSLYTVPRETIPYSNVLLSENTYNDPSRRSDKEYDRQKDLEKIEVVVNQSHRSLFACFSLQRTQVILTTLAYMYGEGLLPNIPVIVDSPLAQKFCNIWPDYNFQKVLKWPNIHFVETFEESQRLINDSNKYIVLASSGMLTGGRILEWLKHDISNPKNTILFCGYSGQNNLASQIKYGDKYITIDKISLPNLANIIELRSFSSHASYDELMKYLSMDVRADKIALVHGDMKFKPDFCNVLQDKLHDQAKSTKVICTQAEQKIYF